MCARPWLYELGNGHKGSIYATMKTLTRDDDDRERHTCARDSPVCLCVCIHMIITIIFAR